MAAPGGACTPRAKLRVGRALLSGHVSRALTCSFTSTRVVRIVRHPLCASRGTLLLLADEPAAHHRDALGQLVRVRQGDLRTAAPAAQLVVHGAVRLTALAGPGAHEL